MEAVIVSALTGFSQTKDVGGGLIPVFAGQRITISDGTAMTENPLNRRFSDTYSLAGDSTSLAERTVVAGGAATGGAMPDAAGTEYINTSTTPTTSYTSISITAARE